jgi:hypothetical protein
MTKGLVALLLATLASFAMASPEGSLVVVPSPSPGLAARLLDDGIPVVRDMERFLILVAPPEGLARLEALGVRHVVLDPSVEGKTFYTILVRGESGLAALSSMPGIEVLYSDGIDAVVRAAEADAEAAAGRGFEIARVFMRPIRTASEEAPAREAGTLVADPLIAQMVDSVSIAEVTSSVQRLQDFRTRYCRSDSGAAAANWIKSRFESFGIESVSLQWFDADVVENVVAVIPGVKDPEKLVVVGGHFDSITGNPNYAPGADDDASGTALVIECARILSRYRFDYTLVFVAFSAEEIGLVGSEAFAALAEQHGDSIIGVVCADMIGYLAPGDEVDLDIVANPPSSWIRQLAVEAGALYVPELSVVNGQIPGGASSDHASFWGHGYNAVLFFEDSGDYSPYIHTSNDVVGISYNSETLAERCVREAVALLATMAEPYDIAIEHVPLADTEDVSNPYRVVVNLEASGTLEPDSLLVRYATGVVSGTAPLAPTGRGTEYEAFLPAQTGGTFVDYYIVAEDTDGDRAVSPLGAPAATHTFFVGTITPIVVDPFETESGWTVGAADDDATKGIWERADPNGTSWPNGSVQPEDDHTPDPGSFCFVTGNAPPGSGQRENEVQGGKTTLLSPVYDLSSYPNAWVSYWRWYSNDTGNLDPDEWVVDVSSDGGDTWVRLESSWTADHSWLFVERNLSDFIPLTSEVRFRFIASDESYLTIVEAAVDDFSIVTYEEISTEVAEGVLPGAGRAVLGRNAPNPFNPATRISYTIPEGPVSRPVRLDVYDVSGRLVRVLVERPEAAGAHVAVWDGTDANGHPVASGVYFYRLRYGSDRETRRMVLLR